MQGNDAVKAEPKPTSKGLEDKDRVAYKLDELKFRVDSYQKYINMALQVNAFYYAITGAVLGFYLGKADKQLAYFLWLPILMGAVLGSIFIYAAHLQKRAAECVKRIVYDLNKDFQVMVEEIPDLYLLRSLFLVFGFIFFIVGLGLTVVPNIGVSPSLENFRYFPDNLIIFARGAYGMLFGSVIFTLLVIYRPHTKFIARVHKSWIARVYKSWIAWVHKSWAGMNSSSNTKPSSDESESKAKEGTPGAP